MVDTQIRKASTEDIGAIRAVAEVAFRHTYSPILTTEQIDFMMDWMYSEESLRSQMWEKENIFYILFLDASPVGYVSIERHKSPAADLEEYTVFNLQKIYLLPAYQGYGYGSLLLEYAEKLMRELGGSRVCYELNVNRNNPAVAFYEHQGLCVNRQGDFPIGNGFYMNDYIMRKYL